MVENAEKMSLDKPLRVADGVWWVGARLESDTFQCHAYFLENGGDGVLLDPGSPLTIESTLDKVAQLTDLDNVKYLVCHHPDPDIAASLPYLSDRLAREDVVVVTEWRAQALLKHYGHRFGYYLVEENNWRIGLGNGAALEFALTPYLHFPGAMVSFDTGSRTLFSSDLFGGFVPDSRVLVSHDLDYIVESARPFHQHYMPSRDLLTAGLSHVHQKWPDIQCIAPQHGHVIPAELVDGAFTALEGIDCGVFTLSDASLNLKRLLRISEARSRITDVLLTTIDPAALVNAINVILAGTHEAREAALFIDVPEQGWTMWGFGAAKPVRRAPHADWPIIRLPGSPEAVLSIHTKDDEHPDADLMHMLDDMAATMRPAVDEFVDRLLEARRSSALRTAAMTDPLTGLGNRRALEGAVPVGDYALVSLDLDFFKRVNDTYGHSVGDVVLARVAGVLLAAVRGDDRAYRLGGEEFLLCLADADEIHAVAVAERVRARVGELDFADQGIAAPVTVSVGVTAVSDATREDFANALRVADAALYESKDSGRDRITVRGASA